MLNADIKASRGSALSLQQLLKIYRAFQATRSGVQSHQGFRKRLNKRRLHSKLDSRKAIFQRANHIFMATTAFPYSVLSELAVSSEIKDDLMCPGEDLEH